MSNDIDKAMGAFGSKTYYCHVERYNCLECSHYKENGWSCPFIACIFPTNPFIHNKPRLMPSDLTVSGGINYE